MAKTEIPIHPEFTRSLNKIRDVDPNRVPAARELFKKANQLLVSNFNTHTAEATIPFTRLSTDELDLPQKLFREQQPSHKNTSSEQILALGEGKKLNIVLLPGFAFPPAGTPLDNERVSRIINLVGHAAIKKQEVTIYSTGLAVSMGGKVTDDWPKKLGHNGFQQHGQTSAEFLKTRVLPQTQKEQDETVLVLLGESMGCYNARETAKILDEDGVDTHLYLKNPPGPEGIQSAFLKKAQVIMGYGMESGIRKLTSGFAKKGTPQGRHDKNFFGELSEYLTSEKNLQPDTQEQRLIKWRAVLADARNILSDLPFSLHGVHLPTILDRGIKDPTSFTMNGLREWRGGKRMFIKENITHVFDKHAHTPQHDIWEWANALVSSRDTS